MAYLEIAQKYLKFKKVGKSYFALCPFHEEKTPSLQIDSDKGLWHCWGCGTAGNIWQLIMRMESVSFPESVQIAKNYGVEPPDNFVERGEKINLAVHEDEYLKMEEQDMNNPILNDFPEKEVRACAGNEEDAKNQDCLIKGKIEDGNSTNILPQTTYKGPVLNGPVRNAEKNPKTNKQPVQNKEREEKTAVYVYEDLGGKIAYEKEKWEKFNAAGERLSKRFVFYRYEGAKRLPGKGDANLILYNLKDVVKSETVFICEGEKDADALKKIWREKNCAFTTNATGADSWDDAYNKFFKGKKVVIFEDNDEAGRKRSSSLKAKLESVVRDIKIIRFEELEEHGDVSDYLERFDMEDLLSKINDKAAFKEISELKKLDVFELRFYKDPNEYILNNFLPVKKAKINTFSGATLEFFIYIALILSKKYAVTFISQQYDYDSLLPYFANIITRIKDRSDIKDILIGNRYKKSDENKTDIIVSTKFLDDKDITVICPAGELGLPDYHFKNGVIYDKIWNNVLTVENLRGKGEIRIANANTKEKNKSIFKLFTRSTARRP